MKKYICEHIELEHNGEVFEKVRWTCKECGKIFNLAEVEKWMENEEIIVGTKPK